MSKTINGAIKLKNNLIDIKQESTELKTSNCNEISKLHSRSPLHVRSHEDMMDHKNLSSSAETLDDTSYIYRTCNRRISVARRENKILADEKDIKNFTRKQMVVEEMYLIMMNTARWPSLKGISK